MEKTNEGKQPKRTSFFHKHLKMFYPGLMPILKPKEVESLPGSKRHYSATKACQYSDAFIRKISVAKRKARRLARYHRKLNRLRS